MIGDKPYWCAIANSEKFGKVAGMADKEGNCTFPCYGSQTAKDFKYVLGPAEKKRKAIKSHQTKT
jgi:hypothetical protein